jgi:DNA-binding transcriptional LysR family regulator
MFDVPLAILVPKPSRLMSADELWQQDRMADSLISVPSNGPIREVFQEGLQQRKVDWPAGIEVSSVEMVQSYVAHGYGIGVVVHLPELKLYPDVRTLPLSDFKRVTFGVLWQGRKTPVLDGILQIVAQRAKQLTEKLGH